MENDVKCGKFYFKTAKLPSIFVPQVGILSENLSRGWRF